MPASRKPEVSLVGTPELTKQRADGGSCRATNCSPPLRRGERPKGIASHTPSAPYTGTLERGQADPLQDPTAHLFIRHPHTRILIKHLDSQQNGTNDKADSQH